MLVRVGADGQPTTGKDSLNGVPAWHQERMPFQSGTPTPEAAPFVVDNAIEQPEGFYAFSGGMGYREQEEKRDRDTDGYYHGHYIDSTGDYLCNGPAVTAITPTTTDSTNGINAFFEATISGTRYLMALSGRYCLQRTADTAAGWGNISHDFGAGNNAVRVAVFRGTQSTPYAFVALQTPSLNAPASPTVSNSGSGGTVAAGVYTVSVSYTTSSGETLASGTATTTTTGTTSTITITSPATVAGATGWYAYVSQAGGSTLTRQQAAGSPTAIGTNLTLTAPPTNTGANPLNANYFVWDMATATTTWTQHASLRAIDFKTYRSGLWMLNTDSDGRYQVQKCLDGGTAPTWGGAFVVADASNQCTSLEIVNDQLFVRSAQGLLAVASGENDVIEITGGAFKYTYTAPNNCAMAGFQQYLLVPLYRSLFAYDTVNGTMDEIGLGTLRRNDSPVAGVPTAMAPYANWFVYTAFYNPANSTAYLMKWGTWKMYVTMFSPVPRRAFVPAWHGALWEQSSQINAMFVSEVSGTPRLYFGDAAGNISYFGLPRNGPDPTCDTGSCSFNTSTPFQAYMPGITKGNPGVNKAQLGVEVTGQNLNLTVSYRTDLVSAYGGSSNLQNAGVFNSDPGGRQNWDIGVVSRWLDILATGTATDSTHPCILKTLVAYQAVRPVFKWLYTFRVRIGSAVVNRNGSIMRGMATADWLNALLNQQETGPVELITPDGTATLALMTDFKIDPVYWEQDGDIEYSATIQMMQHEPELTAGEHAHLANYTHQALANYTHAGLTQL